MRFACALLAVVVLGGCTPENGPLMRPGQDCLVCHGGSPGGTEGLEVHHATRWSLAGTVFPSAESPTTAGIEGVDVLVTDAKGFSFTLTTNLAGNFYTAEAVAFPARVCVRRSGSVRCMEGGSPHGACNYCHALPPVGDAEGRIAAP